MTSPKLRIHRTVLKEADVDRIVAETVAAQIQREKLVAKRDAKIAEITAEHGPRIDAETETIDTNMALLEQWADANPQRFTDARSISVSGHRLGFRLGNPTVKPAKKLTLKAIVANLIKTGGDLAAKYLRIKTDLNKEAILATGRLLESSDTVVRVKAEAELEDIGCEIHQEETFYLDPAREGQADTTLTTHAA